MSEFDHPQPKSDLQLFVESTGKFSPEEVEALWYRIDRNKRLDLYQELMNIHGIAINDPKRAEIMLENLRERLDKEEDIK